MNWTIYYLPEVIEELEHLDDSVIHEVANAIEELRTSPENGKPLGHKRTNLTGCREAKLRDAGIRIIYRVNNKENSVLLVVVGFRADDEVYKIAEKRMKNLD